MNLQGMVVHRLMSQCNVRYGQTVANIARPQRYVSIAYIMNAGHHGMLLTPDVVQRLHSTKFALVAFCLNPMQGAQVITWNAQGAHVGRHLVATNAASSCPKTWIAPLTDLYCSASICCVGPEGSYTEAGDCSGAEVHVIDGVEELPQVLQISYGYSKGQIAKSANNLYLPHATVITQSWLGSWSSGMHMHIAICATAPGSKMNCRGPMVVI